MITCCAVIEYQLTEDTIAAISSPPGRGLRGIVRLSGPQALRIADDVFRARDARPLRGRTGSSCVAGSVVLAEGLPGAPAAAMLFVGPRSYTRQDLVELHTVGSPPVLAMLLERVLSLGARPAGPGEFTARAFLNGAMDLSEAEGVASLIRARGDAAARAAERLMHGQLSRKSAELRERLADLLALVEAEIDFAEEPIDFISPQSLRERVGEIRTEIAGLLTDSLTTERLEELPQIMLVGPTNAGKSTLLNRLTGVPRAICSHLPGTTRDLLSAPMRLGGAEVLLIDSAGLFESDDPVDRLAAAATLRGLGQVDLICYVVDGAESEAALSQAPPDSPARRASLAVLNKIDLLSPDTVQRRRAELAAAHAGAVVAVSALTGEGCDALVDAMSSLVHGTEAPEREGSLPLTARQRQCLQSTADCLERAEKLAGEVDAVTDAAELVAFELREAADQIGRIAGAVTTEELLGRVFSQFCIGK